MLAERKQVKMTDLAARGGMKPRTAAESPRMAMEKPQRVGGADRGERPGVVKEHESHRPAKVRSSFVAPNEKRRDTLRWEMRQRMANPPTF